MKGSEDMGTWKEYIDKLKSQWIGKEVVYENEKHRVVDVDYNGLLLIDKKARMTDTTAVAISSIKRKLTLCCNTTPVQGNSGNAIQLVKL